MNDSSSLAALMSSPSYLLGELGVGKEIYLLRLRGPEENSGFVPLEEFDSNIRSYGSASLAVRIGPRLAVLRLSDQFKKRLFCATVKFDYQSGTFLFGMCREGFEDSFWMEVQTVWQKGYKLTFVPIGLFPGLCP